MLLLCRSSGGLLVGALPLSRRRLAPLTPPEDGLHFGGSLVLLRSPMLMMASWRVVMVLVGMFLVVVAIPISCCLSMDSWLQGRFCWRFLLIRDKWLRLKPWV